MNKTYKNGQELTHEEIEIFFDGKCPDCDVSPLMQGPSGGGSINVYCSNVKGCGSRFNEMGPFVERISDACPNLNLECMDRVISKVHDS